MIDVAAGPRVGAPPERAGSRLRIVHVVRQFAPSVGGLEEAVANLCRHLAERHGFAVRVVTLDRLFREPDSRLPASEVVDGIPVSRIPFLGSRRYPIAPAVLGCLGECDIVHVHAIDFFFDFLAAARPAHRRPLVASTHGGFFHTDFAARLKRAYFASATRLSAMAYDRILASSEADAALFRRIAGARVVPVGNGADLAKFRGRASPVHRRTLLYFGRLSSNKRIETLFDLLRHLRCASPEWRLIVAGSEWDVRVGQLEAAAARAGVAAAVRFVRDPSDRELGALAGEASYFAAPSAYEGFGITAVEAMSAGLVPILSAIPPFQAFVRHAGAGLIIDPLVPEVAARQVLELDRRLETGLPEARRRLTAAAERYGWPEVSDRHAEQYGLVLEGRRVRSVG